MVSDRLDVPSRCVVAVSLGTALTVDVASGIGGVFRRLTEGCRSSSTSSPCSSGSASRFHRCARASVRISVPSGRSFAAHASPPAGGPCPHERWSGKRPYAERHDNLRLDKHVAWLIWSSVALRAHCIMAVVAWPHRAFPGSRLPGRGSAETGMLCANGFTAGSSTRAGLNAG
jgi:hypothetical protein